MVTFQPMSFAATAAGFPVFAQPDAVVSHSRIQILLPGFGFGEVDGGPV
jgi:hypothetical protein